MSIGLFLAEHDDNIPFEALVQSMSLKGSFLQPSEALGYRKLPSALKGPFSPVNSVITTGTHVQSMSMKGSFLQPGTKHWATVKTILGLEGAVQSHR